MKKLGEDQRRKFFKKRLVDRINTINETISKNKLHLFSRHLKKRKSHAQQQLSLKHDRNLFLTLYITCQVHDVICQVHDVTCQVHDVTCQVHDVICQVHDVICQVHDVTCQVHDVDLDYFFQHENHSLSPSLSDYGNIRLGTKADLLQCLEDVLPHSDSACSQREAHTIIIDGTALVNILKTATFEKFDDYASMFMEHIRRQLVDSVCHVDIVFDVYRHDSIKTTTREEREEGRGQGDELRLSAN